MSSKAGDRVLAWRLRSSPHPPSRWAGLPRGLGSQTKSEAEGSLDPSFPSFQPVHYVWGRKAGLPWGQRPGFVSQLCHNQLCELGHVTWPL